MAKKDKQSKFKVTDFCKMKLLAEAGNGAVMIVDYKGVYVDELTGVLYILMKDGNMTGQGFSPLYNADGSLRTLSDFGMKLENGEVVKIEDDKPEESEE